MIYLVVWLSSSDYIVKVISVGDFFVGKTAIARKYATGKFEADYKATIGVDFITKQVTTKDGIGVKLQIWDTAGQEGFASILPYYYTGALGALVVFDVTNRSSFEHTESWLNEILKHNELKPTVILIGNKVDITENRTVSKDEGEDQAKKLGDQFGLDIEFMEASAKTGYNIETIFNNMVEKIIKNIEDGTTGI